MFRCKPCKLDMSEEAQPGFCAKRHRKARPEDFCATCGHGIASANSESVKAGHFTAENAEDAEIKPKQEEETMKKKCTVCGKDYEATSNVQRYCSDCKAAKKKECQAKARDKKTTRESRAVKARGIVSTNKSGGNDCADCRVLDVLMAAGVVTQDSVDAARQLAGK